MPATGSRGRPSDYAAPSRGSSRADGASSPGAHGHGFEPARREALVGAVRVGRKQHGRVHSTGRPVPKPAAQPPTGSSHTSTSPPAPYPVLPATTPRHSSAP